MAKRRGAPSRARSRMRGGRPVKGKTPVLDKAKAIVRTLTARGAVRASTLQTAVRRAGISTRTYRTARKQLRTKAIRASRHHGRRGGGSWSAKA